MYAEPSARRRTPASIRIGRSSLNLRPSSRRPFASINFIAFAKCSMASMKTLPTRAPVGQRELAPLDLVDAQDGTHDDVADFQVWRGVAELDAPGGLRRVEGRGIRGVDIHEPVGRTEVDDLADHGIAAPRQVPSVKGNHADQAIVLVPNAQLCREKSSAFAVRSGARFQPGATDGFARNDDRAKRPTALHWFLSLTHRFETAAPT